MGQPQKGHAFSEGMRVKPAIQIPYQAGTVTSPRKGKRGIYSRNTATQVYTPSDRPNPWTPMPRGLPSGNIQEQGQPETQGERATRPADREGTKATVFVPSGSGGRRASQGNAPPSSTFRAKPVASLASV